MQIVAKSGIYHPFSFLNDEKGRQHFLLSPLAAYRQRQTGLSTAGEARSSCRPPARPALLYAPVFINAIIPFEYKLHNLEWT